MRMETAWDEGTSHVEQPALRQQPLTGRPLSWEKNRTPHPVNLNHYKLQLLFTVAESNLNWYSTITIHLQGSLRYA